MNAISEARIALLCACSAAGLVACGSEASNGADIAAPRSVAISISADDDFYSAKKKPTVRLVITNVSNAPVRILSSMVPSPGFSADVFSVQYDGKETPYIGNNDATVAPTENDAITLQAGEAVGGDIDLSRLYDLSITGHYTVHFNVQSQNLLHSAALIASARAHSMPEPAAIQSNALKLHIEGRTDVDKNKRAALQSADNDARMATFDDSCNDESKQKTSIQNAVRHAKYFVADGLKVLGQAKKDAANRKSNTPALKSFQKWFGKYNAKHCVKVEKILKAVASSLKKNRYKYICDKGDHEECKENSVSPKKAFVSGNDILLCGEFHLNRKKEEELIAVTSQFHGAKSKTSKPYEDAKRIGDFAGNAKLSSGQTKPPSCAAGMQAPLAQQLAWLGCVILIAMTGFRRRGIHVRVRAEGSPHFLRRSKRLALFGGVTPADRCGPGLDRI